MATRPKRKAHYTARIAVRLCEHIALGLTLRESLAREPLGPTIAQFWRWLDEFPDFKDRYERALEFQANMHADRMLEMSREVISQPTKAAAYKVSCDILKWQAEIRNPKKYGQKVQHEVKAPQLKPEEIKSEIKRLEEELGVTSVTATEPHKAATVVVDEGEVIEQKFLEVRDDEENENDS